MKKLSIILACVLVAFVACTKSKEVHPEIGDSNDEIVTVGMKDVHVEYTLSDIAELQKVVFHYSLAEAQQFAAAEMTKHEDFFELTLNNLLSDTLYSYYYELFSMDGETSLTGKKTFHTQAMDTPEPPTPPTPPSDIPEGAINGLFTINANGDQVYFSQGNLQYQASTNTWRFAEHQWDYVGGTVGGVEYGNVYENGIKCNNALISQTYSGWIDLFGWGTSGYNHGAICYQPWSISSNCLDYYAYNDCYGNLSDYTGQADWGFNRIINGGNADNQWRSLTVEEWEFIINQRNTNTNIRYAKAVVNNLNGLILIPDDWNSDSFDLNDINTSNSDYESNVFTTSEWTMLENLGVVFLPCSGYRIAPTMYENDNVYGSCWSASYKDNYHSYFFGYWDAKVQADTYITRANGLTVRMVHDKQ